MYSACEVTEHILRAEIKNQVFRMKTESYNNSNNFFLNLNPVLANVQDI